jgi:hypothetical protein
MLKSYVFLLILVTLSTGVSLSPSVVRVSLFGEACPYVKHYIFIFEGISAPVMQLSEDSFFVLVEIIGLIISCFS